MEEVKHVMFRFFGREAIWVQIEYLAKDFKMDPTHNVGTFICLLWWFSEAQILYPNIINDKEVGCLFSDTHKKHILCNYTFYLFKYDIHNMNKIRYSNFRTYTEAKSACILAEERKTSKVNRIS